MSEYHYLENGAGDGNRTHAISLEGWSSTIELHPQIPLNLVVEGGGFEPPKVEPADLQSDPFGRSGTPPLLIRSIILIYKILVKFFLRILSKDS